ncbi:MAG: prolyl oligopeptidase family serine peptidase, partial [Vulcanimicrobiaceae bacterium]
ELAKTAEITLLTSVDGAQTALSVTAGDGVHASVYLRHGDGPFRQVVTPADGIGDSADARAHFVGHTLYVVTTKRRSHGEIRAIAPGGTFASSTVVVPASNVVIEDFEPVSGGFITRDIDGGDGSARYFSNGGALRARLPIPPQATIAELAGDPAGGPIVVGTMGYAHPATWYRYVPANGTLAPTGIATKPAGDFSRVVAHRVFVPSLDGRVKIPLEIVELRGTRHDGRAPTILTAYGAYGIISRPYFIGAQLAWLERGGVFAQAMIRGGGEYGEQWHRAAHLATKTKSSDDLAACARWLETHGYGTRRHLGIVGGSAGGYLMGLALTRNPEVYRAVVSFVGFYDLLRAELTPNGRFNTPEFGTVTDPTQFAWMIKQSPYRNVRPGVRYPAILMPTGANDPRVAPWQSRKMVAKLQADNASPYPIFLLQKTGQG